MRFDKVLWIRRRPTSNGSTGHICVQQRSLNHLDRINSVCTLGMYTTAERLDIRVASTAMPLVKCCQRCSKCKRASADRAPPTYVSTPLSHGGTFVSIPFAALPGTESSIYISGYYNTHLDQPCHRHPYQHPPLRTTDVSFLPGSTTCISRKILSRKDRCPFNHNQRTMLMDLRHPQSTRRARTGIMDQSYGSAHSPWGAAEVLQGRRSQPAPEL
jgi:hypothetical protein